MNKRTLRDLGDFVAERWAQAASTFRQMERNADVACGDRAGHTQRAKSRAGCQRSHRTPAPGTTPGGAFECGEGVSLRKKNIKIVGLHRCETKAQWSSQRVGGAGVFESGGDAEECSYSLAVL